LRFEKDYIFNQRILQCIVHYLIQSEFPFYLYLQCWGSNPGPCTRLGKHSTTEQNPNQILNVPWGKQELHSPKKWVCCDRKKKTSPWFNHGGSKYSRSLNIRLPQLEHMASTWPPNSNDQNWCNHIRENYFISSFQLSVTMTPSQFWIKHLRLSPETLAPPIFRLPTNFLWQNLACQRAIFLIFYKKQWKCVCSSKNKKVSGLNYYKHTFTDF
jgi:hypothetical protein